MNQPVVVLGLGPAGLFLVRQLSHITTNIYAVGRPDDVGMYSKFIDNTKRYYATESSGIERAMEEISHREALKAKLYVSSDQYLSILIEEPSCWQNYVELSGSGINTLALINDKNTINEYCKKHDVKTPASLPFEEYLGRRPHEFPVIIKWVEKRIETAVNPIGKVKVCRTEEELNQVLETITEGQIAFSELFVQTYIEGKNDGQFSVGGYFQEGQSLADVTVNQIKQYPQGISAMVVSVEGRIAAELTAITYRFAKELSYTGFLEMEYKVDSVSGEIYLLDVNPRPWGWVSILGTVYPDFYEVLSGKQPKQSKQNAIWKSPIRTILSRRNTQNVDMFGETKGYKDAYDIKNSKDRVPSLMIYGMVFKKIMRRIKK